MPKKSDDAKMDYIEFPAKDLIKTKAFYEQAFGWRFTDYGPDYTSFEDGRLAGGFTKERQAVSGGPLSLFTAMTSPPLNARCWKLAGKSPERLFHSRAVAGFTLPIQMETSWLCGRKTLSNPLVRSLIYFSDCACPVSAPLRIDSTRPEKWDE